MKDKYSKLWVFYSGTFRKTGKYPTYEEMGEYMGVSRQRVEQVVRRGVELGYLYEPKKSQKRIAFNIDRFTGIDK